MPALCFLVWSVGQRCCGLALVLCEIYELWVRVTGRPGDMFALISQFDVGQKAAHKYTSLNYLLSIRGTV